MNNQVEASTEFAKSFNKDHEEDFRRKRVRRIRRRKDESPDTAALIIFMRTTESLRMKYWIHLLWSYNESVQNALRRFELLQTFFSLRLQTLIQRKLKKS